jgi:exopolyphosphatase/guanosine-5'-triphosphate,3'-diphosphate pyrophosphatase
MRNQTKLIVDVGTNSILALVARINDGKLGVVSDNKFTTRLGEGLQNSGKLSEKAMDGTVRAIAEVLKSSRFDTAVLVGTEALRKAENSIDFINRVKSSCGQNLLVISGQTEAELSFYGAFFNLDVDRRDVLLTDMGGGSTELIRGSEDQIAECVSVPIGAMILKDATENGKLKDYASFAEIVFAKELAQFSRNTPGTFVAAGGTITSAGAIFLKMDKFDAPRVHGLKLTRDNISQVGLSFEKLDADNRKSLIPFDPQRADLMLPGLGIFLALMGIYAKDEIVVSNGGLRYGAALRPDLVVSC